VQRLFSTFAEGWPGAGLLLQRILTATLLLRLGIIELARNSLTISSLPHLIGSLAGILLLAGLWTPVSGTLIAVVELWIAVTSARDPLIPMVLATLGVTVSMIGPGAWSLDARFYGRKHITI
jgi:putative oxidoreductase